MPAKVAEAAGRLGWAEAVTDWRELVARDDIDLIDICTPGDSHAEIAIAALEAGKHVLCEKPLANTVAEARAMVAAAATARALGVRSMVGFNYRRVPAVALHAQPDRGRPARRDPPRPAVYLQDWITDPEFPLVWRLQKERAGSGALGDIGAHIIDLTQFVTGQQHHRCHGASPRRSSRSGRCRRRPAGCRASAGRRRGEVTVDDAAVFVARLAGGGARPRTRRPASRPAARTAPGRDQRLARLAWPSTWSGSTSWSSTTPPGRRRDRASAGSW